MRRISWSNLLYFLLYTSGIYGLVLWPPLTSLATSLISPIHGIERVPLLIRSIVAFVAFDCCAYWMHRAAHASRLLWFFHKVHHGGPALGPLTTFRFHVVEMAWRMVMQFIPLYILSLEASIPRFFFLGFAAFEMVAHSSIDWRFGAIGRVVVSPAYHAVHHGDDDHRHFAMFLVIWDELFGTAVQCGQSQPKIPAVSNA